METPDFSPVEKLKKGDFFRRKADAKKTFIRGEYNRHGQRYMCTNFDDINDTIYLKKGKEVFINFEF